MITKTSCQHCGQHIEFEAENADSFTECPSCKKDTRLVMTESMAAKRAPTYSQGSELKWEPPGVATALMIFAILNFIGAAIGGLIVWVGTNNDGNPILGIAFFAAGTLGGCILLGFASVVEYTKSSAETFKRIEDQLSRHS